MYKQDLVLNNQQWLMCHKTQPNQIKSNARIANLLMGECLLLMFSFGM